MRKRTILGSFVLLVPLACSSTNHGGTSGGPNGSPASAEWPGFQRVLGLGAQCSAAYAERPRDIVKPLTWIPCASGVTGCEELKWDGALRWDPTGSGDMLEFHARFARDAGGKLTRLLVMHRYPRGPGYQGIPFEAVVYDVDSGAPLSVFRNLGDAEPAPSSSGSASFSSGAECEIELVPSNGAVWVVGTTSGDQAVLVGRADLTAPGAPDMRATDADPSVIDGTLAASDEVLAMEQNDGRILRMGADPAADASAYGPAVRVWLSDVAGTDVIAFNDKAGPDTQLFRLGPDGAFAPLPSRGSLTRTDGHSIAWVEPTATGVAVWARAYDPNVQTLDGAVQITPIQDARSFSEASLADGTYALVAHPPQFGGASTVGGYLVNLHAGTGQSRDLGPDAPIGTDQTLVASSGTHVYFTITSGLSNSALRRFAIPGG